MVFGGPSGCCTTGCASPSRAFVELQLSLQGMVEQVGLQRTADIWVCWLLEEDLPSLKWLFHINAHRIPGKSEQRLKGASPWTDIFVPAAVCLMHLWQWHPSASACLTKSRASGAVLKAALELPGLRTSLCRCLQAVVQLSLPRALHHCLLREH